MCPGIKLSEFMVRSEANTVWNLSSLCAIECCFRFHDEDAKLWSQTDPSGYAFLHITPESPDYYLPGYRQQMLLQS